RIGDYALERQIRVGIEILFEPGHEVPEVEPGRAPGPRHEPLLDEARSLERGQKGPQDDVRELVAVALAVAGRADEDQMIRRVAPPTIGYYFTDDLIETLG